ncbi:MAG: glyoxalase/bleomycin resistance/dioxygenase family protein [Alphaproteobacteria bacterium]|nr:glyoxalase/bleomycin resistance/dioxygenase family protein [Alphaproteobacteria bacterium]
MNEIMGIHHVAVAVPDIELARQFYVDILGFEGGDIGGWEPGNEWIDNIVGLKDSAGRSFMCRAPNCFIEVFQYTSPEPSPQDPKRPVSEYGYTHFGMQVKDIQKVYERLREAGLEFHVAPDRMVTDADGKRVGFSATYGRDYFGNVFEIMEIREGASVKPL